MNKKTIHLVGNAHLDPVWLWRFQEGFAEIKATFQSALDRIEQFDDFIFTSACAAYYQWVEQNAPDMFLKIQQAVKAGRWGITGGMWIQPDCNIPSGESFARHFLLSQRYFMEKFGLTATSAYNVDSFGHNGSLPKLFSGAGINSYLFMRPSMGAEKNYPFSSNLFWWQCEDGSRTLTYRVPDHYQGHGDDKSFNLYETLADQNNVDMLYLFGVGNHGGGPTVSVMNRINVYKEKQAGYNYLYSTPGKYFDAQLAKKLDIPTYTGDLQHHASGCYSAHSQTKELNRKSENRLTSAEKCAALANALCGHEYDTVAFDQAWENVLFNQFHDIMGGCSIKEAYDDARDFYGQSLAIAAKSQNAALQKISWSVDTAKTVKYLDKDMNWALWEQGNLGTPHVVYNPLSWPVKIPVLVNAPVIKGVCDHAGNPVAHQTVRAPQTNGWDGDKSLCYGTLFMAEVPAMGYSTYWVYLDAPQPAAENRLKITQTGLENDHIRVSFDPKTGWINSFFDKTANREFIKSYGAKAVVIEDEHNDTWAHNVFVFDKEIGHFDQPEFTVIDQGPVRAKLRVTTRYKNSTIRQDFVLYPHSTDLEVEVCLNCQEPLKVVKLAFDTAIENAQAVYENSYGTIKKPADGLEEPAQNFAAAQGEQAGFAVLNNGKYSHSVKDGEVRFIAARTAVYADHYGVNAGMRDGLYDYIDLGVQWFKYAIKGFAGQLEDTNTVKRGWELNTESAVIAETYHKGTLPQHMRGASVDCESVIVSAFKQAQDGSGFVLRAYETAGQTAQAKIILHFLNDVEIKADFTPGQVKSYFISQKGQVRETNLVEI